TGDSVGDGTVVAPTAPRYANSAIFDLQDVNLRSRPADATVGAVPTDAARSVLSVTLGAIDASESSALGFGSLVLDIYIDSGPGGHDATLAGPNMLLPADRGWEYALRLTPDGATGYEFVAAPDSAAAAVDAATNEAAPVV